MTSKKLRDVHVSEQFADADSLEYELDRLDNVLADVTLNSTTVFEIAQVLQLIIERFGANLADMTTISVPEGGWFIIL